NALPAYGVARELAGLLAPLAGSQLTLRHNLICGNRSGELFLTPTESPSAAGNQTPTGSEGSGFAASAGCGDPAVLFANGPGPDSSWGTLDDNYFLKSTSPAVDAGDDIPAAIPDPATLQTDFEGLTRPMDGDDDGVLAYDAGALEFGVAPTVSITNPIDGTSVNDSRVEVSGAITGTAPFEIFVSPFDQ
ncbi:MAG: choice-of-anchor Q domain-containing protein, partial [Vicinamibacterales bacterium]